VDKRIVVTGFLWAVFLVSGWNQNLPAEKPVPERAALYEAESGGSKSAFVDMMILFNQGPATAPAVEILQREMQQRNVGRSQLVKEYEDLQNSGAPDEVLETKRSRITAYDHETEVFLDQRQAEVLSPVFETIESAVKKLGKEKGYRAIYVEAQDGADDVTLAVLEKLKAQ